MEAVSPTRIVLSGAHADVGKSLLTLGLAVALRKRNMGLSCCVVGNGWAQAALLRRLSGRFVRFLDERLQAAPQIVNSMQSAGVGADIVLIDGGNSLLEGWNPGNIKGSDSNVAIMTRSPIVLVVDGRRFRENVDGIIRDAAAAGSYEICGIVVNRADPAVIQEQIPAYQEACRAARGSPAFLGALPALDQEPPLGQDFLTYRKNRPLLPRQLFIDAGSLVEKNIDLDALLSFARRASEVQLPPFQNAPSGRRCKIAVTDDSCFNLLCFQDNLDLLRYNGAEVVSFSPLADSGLPKNIGALYFTGAYLGEFARELVENSSMLESIRDFARRGGVIYSEGDGTAFLCRSFTCGEDMQTYEGVGILRGKAVQTNQPALTFCEAMNPDDTILGPQGLRTRAVATAEWSITPEVRLPPAFHVSYLGRQPYQEGFSPGAQIISTLMFTHWGSNPEIARNIVDAATVVQKL